MFRLIPVVAVCALGQPAFAQVYKCQVDGKVEYGDRPCAVGETVALNVPHVSANTAGASEPARREREALLQLEKMRLAREMREERERDIALREQRAHAREQRTLEAQRRKCARMRLHQKWADEDRRRLTGKSAETARVKARRDAEMMAVECPA
jgi:hypothetical protein